jgi:nicotinate-nucleotide pyrophosphorylase (carboxylating)
VADAVFAAVDPALKIEWRVADGATVTPGTVMGTCTGPARALLTAERVALNYMQRMGGIATAAGALARAAAPARALDTRKTAPGLRLTDKWAVAIGGGVNHRIGLWDMAMIKDNHVAAAGGVAKAAAAARAHLLARGLGATPIELEARTMDEVDEALAYVKSAGGAGLASDGKSGVTRIMLDNMALPTTGGRIDTAPLAAAMARIRASGLALETEASGGITVDSVGAVAATGVSHVSCGALTHSAPALDISMGVRLLE